MKAMVDDVASGTGSGGGTGALAAPTGVGTSAAAASSITSAGPPAPAAQPATPHPTARRVHQSGGTTYADGSNQNMELWNLHVTTTLKQTGANHDVIGASS